MAEPIQTVLLIEDAEATTQRIMDALAAARMVAQRSDHHAMGRAPRLIITQQLLNEAMQEISTLIENIDAVTKEHGKMNV